MAVFFVIFGHLNLLDLSAGYLGVDVFFVISGFLITGILLKPGTELLRFYSRRIKRIAPMALLVLSLVSLFSFLYYSPAGNEFTLKDSLLASFSLLNFELAHRAGDYFLISNSTSLFQHYWSLGIEEQFYLFWPFIVLILLIKLRKSLRLLLTSMMLIASLGYFMLVMESNSTVGYYNSVGRVWELMLGALVAIAGVRIKNKRGWLIWIVGSAILVIMALQSNEYHVLSYVLVGVTTAVLLATELSENKVKFWKPIVYLGDISFGLYLWHWPIWILVEREVGKGLLVKLLAISLTIFLAMVSNWLFEKRAINSTLTPKKTIAIFFATIVTFSGTSIAVASIDANINFKEELSKRNQITQKKDSKTDSSGVNNNSSIGVGVENENGSVNPSEGSSKGSTSEERIPSYTDIFPSVKSMSALNSYIQIASKEAYQAMKIKQDLSKIREDIGYFSQDHCPVATTSCTLEVEGKKELYLLGDSHANMWFPAFARLESLGEYRVSSLAIPGCPAVPMAFDEGYKEMGKEKYEACQITLKTFIAAIKKDKPEVLVITSGTQTGMDSWIKRYPALISELKPYVKRIIFLGDFVYAKMDAVECLQNYASINPYKCGQNVDGLDPGYTDRIALEESVIKKTGVFYYSPKLLMCDKNYCPAVVNDIVVYRDRFHITKTYARWVGDLLLQQLDLL